MFTIRCEKLMLIWFLAFLFLCLPCSVRNEEATFLVNDTKESALLQQHSEATKRMTNNTHKRHQNSSVISLSNSASNNTAAQPRILAEDLASVKPLQVQFKKQDRLERQPHERDHLQDTTAKCGKFGTKPLFVEVKKGYSMQSVLKVFETVGKASSVEESLLSSYMVDIYKHFTKLNAMYLGTRRIQLHYHNCEVQDTKLCREFTVPAALNVEIVLIYDPVLVSLYQELEIRLDTTTQVVKLPLLMTRPDKMLCTYSGASITKNSDTWFYHLFFTIAIMILIIALGMQQGSISLFGSARSRSRHRMGFKPKVKDNANARKIKDRLSDNVKRSDICQVVKAMASAIRSVFCIIVRKWDTVMRLRSSDVKANLEIRKSASSNIPGKSCDQRGIKAARSMKSFKADVMKDHHSNPVVGKKMKEPCTSGRSILYRPNPNRKKDRCSTKEENFSPAHSPTLGQKKVLTEDESLSKAYEPLVEKHGKSESTLQEISSVDKDGSATSPWPNKPTFPAEAKWKLEKHIHPDAMLMNWAIRNLQSFGNLERKDENQNVKLTFLPAYCRAPGRKTFQNEDYPCSNFGDYPVLEGELHTKCSTASEMVQVYDIWGYRFGQLHEQNSSNSLYSHPASSFLVHM